MLILHDMKPVLILYATREGQTRHIAEYIAKALSKRGCTAQVHNVKVHPETVQLSNYSAAILAASVHAGRHEPEMESFVRKHRDQLELLPTAFFSVSLSEAGAEDPNASPEEREQSAADVDRMIEEFFVATEWRPQRAYPVAGALAYTHYGTLVRFLMKRIAEKAHASTDTSRDHVFTDWDALDHFVEVFLETPFFLGSSA